MLKITHDRLRYRYRRSNYLRSPRLQTIELLTVASTTGDRIRHDEFAKVLYVNNTDSPAWVRNSSFWSTRHCELNRLILVEVSVSSFKHPASGPFCGNGLHSN